MGLFNVLSNRFSLCFWFLLVLFFFLFFLYVFKGVKWRMKLEYREVKGRKLEV